MGTTKDWRSPDYEAQFEGFERPDFAQEFLRRNPDYIRQYAEAGSNAANLRSLANRWGLSVAIDPQLCASQSKALWLEDANPLALRLQGDEPEFDNIVQEHREKTYRHILIQDVDGNHHIVWKKAGHDGFRIVITLNCDTLVKLRAADRFWRHLEGNKAGPYPSPYRLTDQQKKRLVQTLRTIDAEEDGASKRETARVLHDEEVILSDWSDSAERAHVRRLLRRGKYLSDQGYRNLLNPYLK